MIQSKSDYLTYLEADRRSLKAEKTISNLLLHDVWRFQRLMRRLEFATNCKHNGLLRNYLKFRYRKLGVKLGFTIPINVFGPGLAIAHYGAITVNSGARVGCNCRLHNCVNIGTKAGHSSLAPTLGDNCYIGPGATLFGDIVIGSNTAIGANAAVGKSFPAGGVTLGGVPAKVISQKSSLEIITQGYSK